MKLDLRFILILLCFFLSGFAALLYETVWAREFAFVFGTSELAVVSVLAAYMGGLAAGAAAAARWVTRISRPVLVYGLLELGIALSALAVPWGIRATMWLQAALAGGQSAPPDEARVAGAIFYLACSFALLIVPTGLMGATLPLLARHAVRRESEIGGRVGVLYSVNTAGAALGTAVAGFVLLPVLGLRMTVYAGAATNAIVFCLAALLAHRTVPIAGAPPATSKGAPRFHWVLPLIALSGFVSFTYEVVWMRLLSFVLGGSIQGFATMLASFLLGIAIGSGVSARLARNATGAALGFAVSQIGIAVLSLAAFALVDRLPGLASEIGAGRAGSHASNALIAALGLCPGALCIGAVFPFAVRLLARRESDAGPAAARVYAWNTVGAISGAIVAGFMLLPNLHFVDTMRVAAGLNLLVALAAAVLVRPRLRVVAGVAVAGLALLLVQPPTTPWAVLRHNETANIGGSGEVAYLGVGRSSTVILLDQETHWRLTTNGQPESRIDRGGPVPDRQPTARWLGMLPVLLRPGVSSLLMIGLGGGLSLEAVPSTVEAIYLIELEREVLRAHEVLATLRDSSPLSDPRIQVVVNDARGALALTDARFDAVVSQPSHPWTAGASHLYTREFFSIVAEHLEPGGVFVQWIGLSFVDEALLRSLVATLLEVFPHVCLFRPAPGSVLFAASNAPLDPATTAARALEAAPSDFARYGLRLAEDAASRWILDVHGARRFAEGAAINTDDRNQLGARSAGLGKKALGARGIAQLVSRHDPLLATTTNLDQLYLVRRLVVTAQSARALRLASSLSDPVERMTALGWARSERSQRQAVEHFRGAIRRDPTAQSARFGLLRARRSAVEKNDPRYRELAIPLEGVAAAVVAGWRKAAESDWSSIRALEPVLATADLLDPSYTDAQRLRLGWRAASDDPELRTEAVEIVTGILQASSQLEDVVLGARTFVAAGRDREALQLLDFLSRLPRDHAAYRAGLAILGALSPNVDETTRSAIRERLSVIRRSMKTAPALDDDEFETRTGAQ